MFEPLGLIFKYNEFLNKYEKAFYYNNIDFEGYSSEAEWKGRVVLEKLKLNDIFPDVKLEVYKMLLGKEKDLSSYFSKVFYMKKLLFIKELLCRPEECEDDIIKEFLIKAEEFGFSDIELEIYDCSSLRYLAKYISHYSGYLHIYSQDSDIKDSLRALLKADEVISIAERERAKIINLFKTLLSRTTKYDLDNKYTHESILGKDLLREFFADEYKEVVPSLVYLAKGVIEKELQSGDKAYLALINKFSELSATLFKVTKVRVPLGIKEGIIYKFLEETLHENFNRTELEIKNLEALKCLSEFISFYNGYKGYLHIYSDDLKFERQVRDIIKDENHTYASKKERAKIINLFKTLLSRTNKDDLEEYPSDSILGKELLRDFLEGKYNQVEEQVDKQVSSFYEKVMFLKCSAQQIIERKQYSVNKTYTERFYEEKTKKLLVGIGLKGVNEFEIATLEGSCYQGQGR